MHNIGLAYDKRAAGGTASGTRTDVGTVEVGAASLGRSNLTVAFGLWQRKGEISTRVLRVLIDSVPGWAFAVGNIARANGA